MIIILFKLDVFYYKKVIFPLRLLLKYLHILDYINKNLEYIQIQEKIKDLTDYDNSQEYSNLFTFKDESFIQNLILEVKSLPYNRISLISKFLNMAIKHLIKTNKTPIAKGLEW